MILWSIQPEEVFDLIQREGVYHCDIHKSRMGDFADMQYSWLVSQMKKRIGPPPEGVSFPVWAWYQWRKDRKKPDLRAERWYYGYRGEKFYRLEIDIPDEQVLLSNFALWHVPLNKWVVHKNRQLMKNMMRMNTIKNKYAMPKCSSQPANMKHHMHNNSW